MWRRALTGVVAVSPAATEVIWRPSDSQWARVHAITSLVTVAGADIESGVSVTVNDAGGNTIWVDRSAGALEGSATTTVALLAAPSAAAYTAATSTPPAAALLPPWWLPPGAELVFTSEPASGEITFSDVAWWAEFCPSPWVCDSRRLAIHEAIDQALDQAEQ